ncbi:MAG: cupin domain-containing protein [Bacteroidia bacterium]
MARLALIICILFFTIDPSKGQTTINARNIDSIGVSSQTENLYSVPLFSDSLASSFCILIKKEVKAHKHLQHSEHVIVSEGSGIMKLADETFVIKKGDVIFIPKNTIHSVKTTGSIPLKVISIQAPLFDGRDRIMTEEK